jgi:hypothetical protein
MLQIELYRTRVDNFRQKAEKLEKRENQLSVARLIAFVSGILLFFVLFSHSAALATLALLLCLSVFVWLVKKYSTVEKDKTHYRHLETINRKELECLEGSFSGFPDGSEYISREHPYSYDLDLFGPSSVFQYLNRTTSKPAADMLARWLMAPATIEDIILRQQAVTELSSRIEWRQKLITLGYINKNAGSDPGAILSWVQGNVLFDKQRRLRITTLCLTVLALAAIAGVVMGLPAAILVPVLGINFLYYGSLSKKITLLHNQVSRSSDMLKVYSATIDLIEKEQFTTQKLTSLHGVFINRYSVSSEINRLSRLLNRLDVRLNIMVSVPLNLFFFWDVHYCMALENWKKTHAGEVGKWFSAMADFEALSSLSNAAFNNPDWVMPDVTDEYFILKAKQIGHPLIAFSRRIDNSLEITRSGKTILITGSNMSGKSTFLRTCGVNTVLALAGAPVCAASFMVSNVQLYSSMRISDSLEDNTSSFYAELKRLAAIIKEAGHNPRLFLLLDEILRGTNSNDRYTGSVALIRQLIGYGTVAMVATHDLKLADLAQEMPEQLDNYHFDVKIEGEELYFDYKLNPGICTSLNASILMKKMGIKV